MVNMGSMQQDDIIRVLKGVIYEDSAGYVSECGKQFAQDIGQETIFKHQDRNNASRENFTPTKIILRLQQTTMIFY